jgi:hypothetical protein
MVAVLLLDFQSINLGSSLAFQRRLVPRSIVARKGDGLKGLARAVCSKIQQGIAIQ